MDKPPLSANTFVVISRYTNAMLMAATVYGSSTKDTTDAVVALLCKKHHITRKPEDNVLHIFRDAIADLKKDPKGLVDQLRAEMNLADRPVKYDILQVRPGAFPQEEFAALVLWAPAQKITKMNPCPKCSQPLKSDAIYCPSCHHVFWSLFVLCGSISLISFFAAIHWSPLSGRPA